MNSDRIRSPIGKWLKRGSGLIAATAVAVHFGLVLSEVTHLTGVLADHHMGESWLILGNYYSALTFANRNFGFFAPTVSPDWNLRLSTTDGMGAEHEFELSTPSRELQVKMYSMLGHFSENDDTMDLFSRSWSVYAMNQIPGARKVDVTVTRNLLPSMAEYRAGKRVEEQPFYHTVFER